MLNSQSRVPVRTIAATIAMVLLTAVVLLLGWGVRRVLTWIVVAALLAVILGPIPHYLVLLFLDVAAVVVVLAWFAIVFTGRYPRGMFDFVEGVVRWHNHVVAYALVLVTDRYPPFRLTQ